MRDDIYFNYKYHEFSSKNNDANIYDSINNPLSVIVQVTRKCPLKCKFCSESAQLKDPSLQSLEDLKDKLKGVKRVYISGGEPLLRKDIFDLIKSYRKSFDILGLPTNCIYLTRDICLKLRGNIDYINAGLDGPRKINNKIRGEYDKIIEGLVNLRNSDIEVSLSTVILKLTLPYLQHVVQIADDLNIIKVKMVIPVCRGRAKGLRQEEFASKEDILNKFNEIENLKNILGWKPRVKFAFWDKNTEGYAIIIYPNRMVYAWPVFDSVDCVLKIGDLNKETMSDIWRRYPYKKNHINKYIGISMHKT